jgi:thioredoxin-related protein
MRKPALFFAIIVLVILAAYGYRMNSSTAQPKTSPKAAAVKSDGIWTADWNAALVKAKAEKKPVFVDFYTDWCGWCKKLDQETYADAAVQKKLREEWINIKVDAEDESKRGTFDGKVMTYPQLTRSFGVRGYPALLFLDKEGKPVGMIPGFLPAKEFGRALDYYKQELYTKKIDLEKYVMEGKS